MSPERIPPLSEQQRIDLQKTAEHMRTAEIGYPAALRKTMLGRGISHEPDIKKAMSALAAHIDAEVERQNLAAEEKEAERADIEESLAEIRREEQLADMRRVAEERGGDPED